MNSSMLKDVLTRAENWPVQDQERLLEAALQIEQIQKSGFNITDEDLKILSERRSAADAGDFASNASVAAVFNQFRTK